MPAFVQSSVQRSTKPLGEQYYPKRRNHSQNREIVSEFRTPEGRAKAYENLKAQGIDGLVAIGGDGTFTGADFFSREYDIPVMCIPGTIDNDLYGSDYTLGYDTATNTVIDAIDKIRDTAASHGRLFFIEVMGRDSGCIAANAG
ncbi:hypothetical protein FQR65_LT18547 [Abscondita terminalis]|nr:hypothetical protein FQR65_LT18547 [Abscondita terminalis]